MSKPPSITDFAEWAEDRFSGLCSFAGVTRNKSGQDRTGWDYLIEFPPAKMPDIPADLHPAEKSARVQIKSKRSGPASAPIKLSNALRFAKDQLPCFVVLFLASNGSEPVRIFCKHFWQDEIGQSLKRARKAHAENKQDLNKQTVTLSFDASDEHTHDLIVWMAQTVEKFGENYADAKATLVRTLGFEQGRFHGNIQFKLQDLQAFVDHQIGLTPGAPPLVVSVKEKRFGIAGAPLFEGTPDFARIQSHPQPCRVRIRGAAGSDFWLDGNLFSPVLPNLPTELRKIRIVADFIEIVLTATPDGDVTFHLDNDERRSLPRLRTLTGILRAAREGPLQFQVSRIGGGALPFSTSISIEAAV
jgi:hypothetical protein